MNNDYYVMKPLAFGKWQARREAIQKDAGLVDKIYSMKADDLTDQYKRVFKREDRTATIMINGPLSPDGPDITDIYLGYGGTAYANIIKAAKEIRSLKDRGDIDSASVIFNTPGGTVDGIDAAYQELKTISDFTTGYNAGDIASGGVWLASALDRVEPLTPVAMIGSIGVVASVSDWSGYLDNFGIKQIDITNTESPNKRPDVLTPDGVEVIKRELDDIYDVFVARVTSARTTTREQINSLKGEMLIAHKAISIGLMQAPEAIEAAPDAKKKEKKEEAMEEITTIEAVEAEAAPIVIETPDALTLERERIIGLCKVSGTMLSDEVRTAITIGADVGTFAVKLAEAREAKAAQIEKETRAEVEAAKEIRQAAKPPISGIASASMPTEDDNEIITNRIDSIVASTIKGRK